MRNDSALYTGLSSAATRQAQAKKREQAEQKRTIASRLKPEALPVMDLIAKEKEWVRDQLANLPFKVASSKEDLNVYLLACQMHLNWTERLANQMKVVLKLPKEAADE